MTMTPQQWPRVKAVLEEALLLTGAARASLLAEGQLAAGRHEEARATLDEADALVRTNQERFWAAPIAPLREQLP